MARHGERDGRGPRPQPGEAPGGRVDGAVDAEERRPRGGWQHHRSDGEIDGRVADVHVAPVDDAAQLTAAGVDHDVAQVQIAVAQAPLAWEQPDPRRRLRSEDLLDRRRQRQASGTCLSEACRDHPDAVLGVHGDVSAVGHTGAGQLVGGDGVERAQEAGQGLGQRRAGGHRGSDAADLVAVDPTHGEHRPPEVVAFDGALVRRWGRSEARRPGHCDTQRSRYCRLDDRQRGGFEGQHLGTERPPRHPHQPRRVARRRRDLPDVVVPPGADERDRAPGEVGEAPRDEGHRGRGVEASLGLPWCWRGPGGRVGW